MLIYYMITKKSCRYYRNAKRLPTGIQCTATHDALYRSTAVQCTVQCTGYRPLCSGRWGLVRRRCIPDTSAQEGGSGGSQDNSNNINILPKMDILREKKTFNYKSTTKFKIFSKKYMRKYKWWNFFKAVSPTFPKLGEIGSVYPVWLLYM
jgi:hypothetical protein